MDFHELPVFNASKSITRMLATSRDNASQRSKREFVPFSQERDHLGRLLSSRPQTTKVDKCTQGQLANGNEEMSSK